MNPCMNCLFSCPALVYYALQVIRSSRGVHHPEVQSAAQKRSVAVHIVGSNRGSSVFTLNVCRVVLSDNA